MKTTLVNGACGIASAAILAGCITTQATKTETTVTANAVAEALLPDTGQSRQFDVDGSVMEASESSLYTGQDASVQGNAPCYQDNGDGTITDLNTGLMWQKAHDFTRRDMATTIAHVAGMELGGHDDWRVPTIKELYSIAHFDGELLKPEEGDARPYIDTDVFDYQYDNRLMFAGQFYSSTIYNYVRLVRDVE